MAFVKLEDVHVEFPIYSIRGRSLRDLIVRRSIRGRLSTDGGGVLRVKALNEIALDVNEGDRIGLMGPNGSGKSTLLRVMAGILEPYRGNVTICGRVGAILDLTLGMEPELTARENAFLRGRVLGLSTEEIRSVLGPLEQFVELGASFDLPVRTYSSGMIMRLAFGITTSVESDILIIDEVVGAGDQGFVKKAADRLDALIGRSRILVMASHNMDFLEKSCNKGCFLTEGRVAAIGPIKDVIGEYNAFTARQKR